MTITCDYDQGILSITQKYYVDSFLERFGMDDCNSVHTPGYGSELSKKQPQEALLGATATKLYQTIVGSVSYLTKCTRYDMCYSVNQFTRACSKPAQAHMAAAKHVLRYQKGRPDLPITYKKGQFRLHGYTDASFAAHPHTRKSTTGSIVLLSGGPFSFGSKTPPIVSQSTGEAELNSLSYASKEAVYLSNFLNDLTFKTFNSVPIHCDSTGTLTVAGNATYSSRTKHIAMGFFFIRELVNNEKIKILTCSNRENARYQAPRKGPVQQHTSPNQGCFRKKGVFCGTHLVDGLLSPTGDVTEQLIQDPVKRRSQ